MPDDRVDQVRGRLDAVLIAAKVAPTTSQIGIVPVATTTHTEPFHLSKAIATLDYVSAGRAGVQVRTSGSRLEAEQFGRRVVPDLEIRAENNDPVVQQLIAERFDEAADYIEVLRRLWDSWEDDAEIRDVSTGRFVDREKLHYIDFDGRWFSVRGPSITPRPPQGQPLVTALAHATIPYRLAAQQADAVFVTPHDTGDAQRIVAEIRTEEALSADGSTGSGSLPTWWSSSTTSQGRRCPQRPSRRTGWRRLQSTPLSSPGPRPCSPNVSSPGSEGLAGFRLRPGTQPHDLEAITRRLVPLLQQRGAFRSATRTPCGAGSGSTDRPTGTRRSDATDGRGRRIDEHPSSRSTWRPISPG